MIYQVRGARSPNFKIPVVVSSKTIFLIGAHRGIPNELMRQNSQVVLVDPHLLPDPDVAVQEFESFGGNLTLFSPFGHDPLQERLDLVTQRETEFHRCYPDFGLFLYCCQWRLLIVS